MCQLEAKIEVRSDLNQVHHLQGRIQDEVKELIASFKKRNIGFKEYRT